VRLVSGMGRLILDRVDFYFNLDGDRMGGFDAKFNLAIDRSRT
jgi:hypothetical protein